MSEFFALSRMEILYLVPLPLSVLAATLVLWVLRKERCRFIAVAGLSFFSLVVGVFAIGELGRRVYLVGLPQLLIYVAICVFAAVLAALVYALLSRPKDGKAQTESTPAIATSAVNENQTDAVAGNPLLTKCAVCGREIAKSAKTCPGCGAKNKQPMNKKPWLIIGIVVVVLMAVLMAVFCWRFAYRFFGIPGFSFGSSKEEILNMGETYTEDGVSFTLNDFCFAERTDGETYDPNMIDGVAFAPNDGYIFAYINYTIDNGGKEAFSHFMDMDVLLEYSDGYTYGESQLDYKATCTEEDKYNLDVDPLMSKTYHHIITNFPKHLAEGIVAEYNSAIYVTVNLGGKTAKFIVPHNAATTINPGQEKPAEDISFTEADEATKQFVSGILMQNTYTWQDGNIDCQLTFDSTQAQLTQNMAGTNFVSTGEYVIGTDKIKVNYGGGDVFYGWTKNGDSIDLHLIE